MKKSNTSGATMKAAAKNVGYIISNPSHSRIYDNIQLLRITISEEETKIDFGYQATSHYIKGGWIKINPYTFIQPTGSNKKLFLTNATNIPYGPEKLHFNSSIEWRYFSLYFPSLLDAPKSKKSSLQDITPSKSINSFDLIENEKGDETDFNFYTIRLDEEKKKFNIY